MIDLTMAIPYVRASLALSLLVGAGCIKRNPEFIGATGAETGDDDDDAVSTTAGTNTTGPSDDDDDATTSDTDPTSADSTDSTGTEGGCLPNLESIRATIFEPKCTGEKCHEGELAAAALDLMTADLFDDLLDVPSATCFGWSRIVGEDPQSSILYARVAPVDTCIPDKPVEHDDLTEDELECVASWIMSIENCERCGGMDCVDNSTSALHCGECQNPCPTGISCVDSVCNCPEMQLACGDSCTDTTMDSLHCGECDNDCAGATCDMGTCDCLPSQLNCGSCVDPMSNNDHCGDCDQPCGLGETCQMGSCECSDIATTLSGDVQPILTANCTANNCHDATGPKKNLNLEAGSTYSNTVNVEAEECNDGRIRVVPGDPDNSYLMQKMLGVEMCSGVQMPQSGGPGGKGLTDEEWGIVWAWICQGALDN